MAGTSNARRFTESDKAAGLVALAANGGNVKRTARELNVNTATMRRWRDQAAHGIGPDTALVVQAQGNFVNQATRVRDKALAMIEAKLDAGEGSLVELNRIAGTMDDKARLALGMPNTISASTSPSMSKEDLAAVMTATVAGVIAAAKTRHEVIEATIVRELPASTPSKLRALG